MKISYQQLKKFIDVPFQNLPEILTDLGLEVEKTEENSEHQDQIFEIGLTPNRADAMSHYGVARDLFAYFFTHQKDKNLQLQLPETTDFSYLKKEKLKFEIQNSACPFYSGIQIENLTDLTSPIWLKNALQVLGLNSKNLVVDATNYVMLQLGLPLHAFDLNILGTEIRVGSPIQKTMITLDGLERILKPDDLVIGNAQTDLCLAGVLGSQTAAVTEKTKNIFIEIAVFDPVSVRKTAKRLGIHTDASFRFERGIDFTLLQKALFWCADLILKHGGGQAVAYLAQGQENLVLQREIEFSKQKCDEIIGVEIPKSQLLQIFQSLAIEVLAEKQIGEKNSIFSLKIPTFRVDVTREIDVVEEVLRVYGFNAVPISKKMCFAPAVSVTNFENKLSDFLVAQGFTEVMNNSLTVNYESIFLDSNHLWRPIQIKNPAQEEFRYLRNTLLFGLLENVKYNQNRRKNDLQLFEWGKTYQTNITKKLLEKPYLALLLTGRKKPEQWNHDHAKIDFFTLKGKVEAVFLALKIEIPKKIRKISQKNWQDRWVYLNESEEVLVEFGAVSIEVLRHFELSGDFFYAQFHWENIQKLLTLEHKILKEIPKTQAVRRDLALLVPIDTTFTALVKTLDQLQMPQLQHYFIFDHYQNENLALQGKKSYGLAFILQDLEHTLQDVQIETYMQEILTVLQKEHQVVLR